MGTFSRISHIQWKCMHLTSISFIPHLHTLFGCASDVLLQNLRHTSPVVQWLCSMLNFIARMWANGCNNVCAPFYICCDQLIFQQMCLFMRLMWFSNILTCYAYRASEWDRENQNYNMQSLAYSRGSWNWQCWSI